ncbi:hypothetical protein SAMN04488128_1011145 [Chitinophaga eiseniae]|uniref:Uncharacterized protein n=1 Tax=Chitinophaga eiseniae TaxID=634771 RepID=A0A1T4MKS4_9BACT|nr:hypothetical protein [Chitinophaga eiseniae]SJZ67543.1 hypothetical protein SAMN04488128_1011145 [Chitinophaga eiseniae]
MILSQSQVENIARQYYPKIATAITAAFADYMEVRAQRSANGVVDFKPRTCASLIHDFTKVRLKNEIGEDPEVLIGEFNGIFGMLIQGSVFIRFKKLNDDLSTSNVQTGQTENYNNQANFAGFGGEPTLLTAGYRPDKSWTSIQNIHLVCRSGDAIVWQKDLTSEVKQTSIFTMEEEDQTSKTGRVSVKKGIQKTGTDDN